MDENTLKQLWLDSDKEQRIEINSEKLLATINQKLLNMDKLVNRRDRLEIFVAICMIPLFVWWLLMVPQILAKIGAAIIIGGCLLVILKLVSARRVNVKEEIASATKNHLMVSLQRVRNQIKLLNTVLWWYFLPFFIGVICFFYSYSITLISKAVYTIIVAALYGYIYYLNKRALKKHLKPLENNIQKALDELSSEE
jgi:Flp pilus assembly protein TadB